MAGLRVAHWRIVIRSVGEPNPSRRHTTPTLNLFRSLGAAPTGKEAFEIGKAAGISAAFDVVEQMLATAVAILPTLGKKGFKGRWCADR